MTFGKRATYSAICVLSFGQFGKHGNLSLP